MGSREFDVEAGKSGKVYINGSDSKLLITAPEPVNDVVLTHHYRILKEGREYREIDVLSGRTGTVEHLNEGEYTIEVSETYDGFKGYTVFYPSTSVKEQQGRINTLTTTDNRSWVYFSVNNAKQLEFYGYGPLYDASGKKLNSMVTYQPNYGVANAENKIVRNAASKSSRKGWDTYTLNTPKRLIPPNDKLYVAISNVSDANAKSIDVFWREYKDTKKSKEIKRPSSEGDRVTVNGLTENYITITKPEDENMRGGDVKYYYTIKDSNGNLIGDYIVTDESGNVINVPKGEIFQGNATTVTLRAGQTVKISGLKQGANYQIYESVEEAPARGFRVKLEDTKRTVTEAGRGIEIQTLGEREVKISKTGNSEKRLRPGILWD